jgi:hypothetical protein
VFDDSFAPVAQIKCSFSLSFLPITTGGGRMDDGPRGDGRERERERIGRASNLIKRATAHKIMIGRKKREKERERGRKELV